MNKQELISRINFHIQWNLIGDDEYTKGKRRAFEQVLEYAKELKEPETLSPEWVVRYTGFESERYYFREFGTSFKEEREFRHNGDMDSDKAFIFTDKQKAEAVALLIDGVVEEYG